jgi:hypothetical protein
VCTLYACVTTTTAAAADHAAKKAAAAAEKKKAELDVQAQAVWRIGTDQFHRDFRHNICLRVRHLLTFVLSMLTFLSSLFMDI